MCVLSYTNPVDWSKNSSFKVESFKISWGGYAPPPLVVEEASKGLLGKNIWGWGKEKMQGCIKFPFPPPWGGGNRIKLLGKKIKWGRRKGEGKKGREREEGKGKGREGEAMREEMKGKGRSEGEGKVKGRREEGRREGEGKREGEAKREEGKGRWKKG